MKILFKGIVGSTAYGLNTETSDVDIKFVYLQSNKDILSNKYKPQTDVNKDEVELGDLEYNIRTMYNKSNS